jgi:hypothetical protein
MHLFLGRFEQIKPCWTCHTQFFYIIDKKKLKMEPKFKMAPIVKKSNFLLAVLDELEAKKDDNNINSEELKVRAM